DVAELRDGADISAQLQRAQRTGGCVSLDGKCGGAEWGDRASDDRRGYGRAAFVYAAFAGSRPGSSDFRGNAAQQLSVVAARVRRDLCDANSVAGFSRLALAG